MVRLCVMARALAREAQTATSWPACAVSCIGHDFAFKAPKNPPMQKATRAALLGGAAAALVTLPGLWSGTLWDNSETTYGEVAREVVLRGDFIVMHQNAAPWYVQPPLYFWIGAVFIKLLGTTAFALRLPSALATIAMGALTGYAAARALGSRTGIYAGVVLSTCLMQAVIGRLAIMDALLDLCVCAALFCWLRALLTGRQRDFVAGWIACAFGFLAKGPVAPAIALLVIGAFALWERRFTRVAWPSWRAWLVGLVVFAAIVVPWFAALVHASGAGSVVKLIGYYTVGRYTGTIENQSGPLWYYLPALILGFFPWIAFIPVALAFAVRASRTPQSSMIRFALMWALLPLLFFSFAKTKLPNYIALEMPALAILVAAYADEAVRRIRSRSLLFSTAAIPVFILLLGIAVRLFSKQNKLTGDLHAIAVDLAYLGIALFLGSAAAFAALWGRERSRESAAHIVAGSMIVATSMLGLIMLPRAEALKPIPHLAAVIDAQRRPGDNVAIINVAGGNALMFYTRPGIYILKGRANGGDAICSAPRTFLVAARGAYIPFSQTKPPVIATWDKDALYLYTRPRSCATS